MQVLKLYSGKEFKSFFSGKIEFYKVIKIGEFTLGVNEDKINYESDDSDYTIHSYGLGPKTGGISFYELDHVTLKRKGKWKLAEIKIMDDSFIYKLENNIYYANKLIITKIHNN
jgi:hypothetical protein